MSNRNNQRNNYNKGGGYYEAAPVKQKHTVAKVIAVLAVILAIAYVITSCVIGGLHSSLPVWNPLKWVKGDVSQDDQGDGTVNIPGNSDGNGGAILDGEENNGIALYSAKLPASTFAANGIDPQADSAYRIIVTVKPDYATDKTVIPSVCWRNAASEFASGKTVTDYGIIDLVAGDDSMFNFVCKQDFGEPIILKFTSQSNPEVYGECTVNYYQRIKSCDFTFTLDDVAVTPTLENGIYKVDYTGAEKDYKINLQPVYSNYTVADEFTTEITGSLTSAFGYTATESLTTLKIAAGITGGDPTLSENAIGWCNMVKKLFNLTYNSNDTFEVSYLLNMCLGKLFDAYGHIISPEYRLTAEDKQHPRCAYYLSVLENADKETVNNEYRFTNADSFNSAKANYAAYQPAAYNYYGASIATYNDFVVAANRCNANNSGVVQYTVAITGTKSNYETVLKLGYNGELKVNVQDVDLSDTDITI